MSCGVEGGGRSIASFRTSVLELKQEHHSHFLSSLHHIFSIPHLYWRVLRTTGELVSWLSAGECGWRGGQESSDGQRGLLPVFRTPLVRGALGSVPNSRQLALFSPCGRDDDELLSSHP